MTPFEVFASITTLAALFSWINHRWVHLPQTIGLLAITMVSSLAIVILHATGVFVGDPLVPLIRNLDFHDTLLNGMLGAMLFAGALHLQVDDLLEQKWAILLLATGSVVLSTLIVGGGSWLVFRMFGLGVPFLYCLLFGALISPTDPIAVSAILRGAGVPHSLYVKITGESLFNDGVGVVVFLVIFGIATTGAEATAGHVLYLFAEEVFGGLLYGAIVGYVAYRLLKSVDQYKVEILITLALVTGGYALAQRIHVSGPLAMVVAGLMVGNQGRALAMSPRTRERLDSFWELADDFLNAVLFVLIGVEVVVLEFAPAFIVAGLVLIPLILLARWTSVSIPITILRALRRPVSPHAIKLLTWSGLRGGISVALALSLPAGGHHDLIVLVTYVVVAFSILVQGLTVDPLARRLSRPRTVEPAVAAGGRNAS
ncbi:MAG: sodium:proton antiporter [Candidatus Eisenbacteria bacterium]